PPGGRADDRRRPARPGHPAAARALSRPGRARVRAAVTAIARIAMWSGPRNISTALMRAFENRADTVVWDEPFYAAYLAMTGIDHPMRAEVIAAGPADWRAVVARLTGPMPGPERVFYQKHMTH